VSDLVKVYVIDDDPSICQLFEEALKESYDVTSFQDGESGIKAIEESTPDVLLLDIMLPGKGGMEILEEVREKYPRIVVIMVTAYDDVETAVRAVKLGAHDYIAKPFDLEEVEVTIEKGLENRELREEVKQLRSFLEGDFQHSPLIGNSKQMEEVKQRIEKVVNTDTAVLIQGESGTGKEVVANSIHYNSSRSDQPFVAVNCAAIPSDLLESELFGHKKGAFTGAEEDKKGKIELADGGTLFLDEIGAMPFPMQAKMLRVLQDQQVMPVGGEEARQLDFRLISATSSNIEKMVEEDRFRRDLYYRINVFEIKLPPLRERKEDIALFCDYFLQEINKKVEKEIKDISPEARELLEAHDWPGNVRELRNALESAAVVAEDAVLRPEDFDLLKGPGRRSGNEQLVFEAGMSLAEAEEQLVKATLQKYDGNITRAAKELGVTRKTLRKKRDDYGIEV